MRSRLLRYAATLLVTLATAAVLPRWICGLDADRFFRGDRETQLALANEVAGYIERGLGPASFSTGAARFDGEWSLVTHQMAVLGLGQVAREHPELEARLLPSMRRAVDQMLTPAALAFGAEAWQEPPLASLASSHGHAYLGYLNLALGMLRRVDPTTPHAALHDRLTAALARRIERSPSGLIETYPHEAYPADVSAVVGSIGLHGELTLAHGGRRHQAVIERWGETLKRRFKDPGSGYLVQSARPDSGAPVDGPRGSGTAIAAYFLSFALPEVSRELYLALASKGHARLLGFGGIREHPLASQRRGGDIDSGPVLLGVSVAATGFALAAARTHNDRSLYTSLYRTAHLFGAPVARRDGRRFLAGGPIGNALLLAMLTAPKRGVEAP